MLDLPEITATSTPKAARPAPAETPECALVTTVGPRVFNRLASGALSALVLRAEEHTPAGHAILVVNAADQSQLSLQLGGSIAATGEPGLEPGYKAVSVNRLPVDAPAATSAAAPAVALPVTAPVSMALAAASVARHNMAIVYGNGSIHGPALKDEGTVLLRTTRADGTSHDQPTRVAVMMKGDMEGIAAGYMLVTPPQRQPVAQRQPVVQRPGLN